ncbi:transporter substrate-binding domain-containing protein [Thiospirochaeta perfilievii]|uniref:Transporter substrate-binding domain-containing protein n=1 Tax=Thiospirochaeta perfilievii TaxID=252967 RepID=A0A5C1QCX0_9SPIO|nr:transporter substrate-binding domain-containing protein [Thiospirochaeta perfilievii]QEN05411.1 transporter substrate-binding domain-containing protein [Thiospirochaeta perfilievii]
MRRTTKLYLIISYLIFPIIFSFSLDNDITVVTNHWYPYSNESSPREGLSIEIIIEAFKTQNYTVTVIITPWARAIREVLNSEYDILANVWFSKERAEEFLYSDYYYTNTITFISNIDDPFEYTNLESLSGKTIGTIRDFYYNELFMNSEKFIREPANDLLQNILKVVYGRIDLTLSDEVVAKSNIRDTRMDLYSKIYFSKKPLIENKLYITCSYKNSRNKELIEAFNRGLEVIIKNGEYKRIINKYIK